MNTNHRRKSSLCLPSPLRPTQRFKRCEGNVTVAELSPAAVGCAMPTDQPSLAERRGNRFVSQEGFPARVMAIDGTWCRDCKIMDVSDFGAKLQIDQSVEGLRLREFF